MKNHTPSQTGKLTVFLGASSGVGKTYAMLKTAYEKLSQGINIYISIVENNNNEEFGEFLKKIPIIKSEMPEKQFKEIEIDSIVSQKPDVIIIDNLASHNQKGHRHANRYQDVEELLQSGIDVYTTLNIYQIESLKDITEQITGIKVTETVPDRLLENAEIKLIDISHEELLQRLRIGKISLPTNTELKSEKFFRLGNVNALRELALRYTAQRVDRQLTDYMKAHDIKGPWQANERIMACIGPSPFSSHIIRTTRRMADGLKAEWYAVYVDTQQRLPVGEKEYEHLNNNLRLADELGAEVVILNGENTAQELLAFAERKNITQIVIGKPLHSKLYELWKGSIVDNVVRGSRGISVHIIPGKYPTVKEKTNGTQPQLSFLPYLLTIILIILITIVNFFIGFDPVNIALLYLLPVLFSGAYWGRGPSILASILGVLSFDIFFIPPTLSITVEDLKYVLSFAIFLLVAVMTGTMANKLRTQATIASRRESRTAALYALSRKIAVETDISGILNTVVGVITETIDGEAIVLLPDITGELVSKAFSTVALSEPEFDKDTAYWVFTHGKIAGNGTETWGEKDCLYIPLRTEEKSIGVLIVKSQYPQHYLSTEQSQLLEAFANLTAISVYSLQLSAEAQQTRNLIQSEKLRTALFNSISHELRTPLASIIGAVTSLLEEGELYNQTDKNSLLQTINDGALQMNRLVGNLLNMARLESGMTRLKTEWCDIQEIIGVALRKLNTILQDRNIVIDICEDIPLIKADFSLIEQVLTNLLDNAQKYSFPATDIYIEVKQVDNNVNVYIKNTGQLITEENKDKIFDKFYRLTSNQHISGTGLGLSICKGIIEAHDGQIWVDTADEKTIFAFSLPIVLSPPHIPSEKDGELNV